MTIQILQKAKKMINEEILELTKLGGANHQFIAGMVAANLIVGDLIQEEQDKAHEYYSKSNKLSEL